MLIRKPAGLEYSNVTPKQLYINRRRFLAGGTAIAGAWALPTPAGATMKLDNVVKSAYKVDEKVSSREDITTYNNYYEFGTQKEDPSHYANTLRPAPWQVQVGGLVNKPKTYDLDSVMKIAPLEERIYRAYFSEGLNIGDPAVVTRLGTEAGLDSGEVADAIKSPKYELRLKNNALAANQRGVNGVPTFFIGEYPLVGAQSPDAMRSILKRATERFDN